MSDTDHSDSKEMTTPVQCGVCKRWLATTVITPYDDGWVLYKGLEFYEYLNEHGYLSHEPQQNGKACCWAYGLHGMHPKGRAKSFLTAAKRFSENHLSAGTPQEVETNMVIKNRWQS